MALGWIDCSGNDGKNNLSSIKRPTPQDRERTCIVVVALENVFHKNYTHWRLLIVFTFGLIHGLGFAGAMATRLDSTSSLVVGLLGINLGVEIGQLAVISVALIATFWISDLKKYRKFVVIPGSLVIAAMGIWWVIERISAR